MAFLPARRISPQSPEGDDDTGNGHDDDDDDDDGVYLKAVSCEFLNLQIIRIICKCEVMM